MNTAPWRMIGRDDLVTELSEGARNAASPLTVVTGDAGAGHTSLLRAVEAELTADGTTAVPITCTRADRTLPYAVLFRVLTRFGALEDGPAVARWPVRRLVAKLSEAAPGESPATAAELATAVFAVVRHQAPVVLIDDAHWLDPATARVFGQLATFFGTGACTVVAAARWAGSAPEPAAGLFSGLTADGLARRVLLRPLTGPQCAEVLRDVLRARPDADLVRTLRAESRGNPAALTAAVTGYRAAGRIRVVDRTAYLLPWREPLALPESHPLLGPVRDAGPHGIAVAGATAVLAPLGELAPRLGATALGLDEEEVQTTLRHLVDARVLVRGRTRLRFRLPLLRAALEAGLPPYRRRNLAALAVEAVWDGTGHIDGDLADVALPDWLADAGSLVDPDRSSGELLARGGAMLFTDGGLAERWLDAAARRVRDPAMKAHSLMAVSAARAVHERPGAAASTLTVLTEHAAHLSPEQLQEMAIVYLTGLCAEGDQRALREIADGRAAPLPGGPAVATVNKAFALMLVARWREGRDHLLATADIWRRGTAVTADFGEMFLGGAGVMLGDLRQLRRMLDDPGRWRARHLPQHRFEQIRYEANMLLMLGELGTAMRLLESTGTPEDSLPGPDRFLTKWLRGEWRDAMEVARRSIVDGVTSARPLAPVKMLHGAIRILGGQGWLGRAAEMAASARSAHRHLAHLIDHAEAMTLRVRGDRMGATALLRSALRSADDSGFVLGTEQMWAELAAAEHDLGNREAALRAVERGRGLADSLRTDRARLASLLARAHVLGDLGAAEEAVALAEERDGMPHENGNVFMRAAMAGVRPKQLLPRAYELFGEVDALLWRARLRARMRERGVPVPGRAITTLENERLLAILVAEGLSNREVASTLGTSEKSVEGQLTRLFSRIGYHSRVELAAAALTGEFPG
ncbi:AAA family ATPase [Amycolatopsis sp. CA-230715]|uniref:AAA family ATPase n=1 Tax=Amycolatopsis sp. CA-230715 TaxID=2745196 RepID=UPI001C026BE0|nr:LuxR family transcriptional regulator [Amycolatopsis sp. CA-230715]